MKTSAATRAISDQRESSPSPVRTTLLDLVFSLRTSAGETEDQLVTAARERVRTGQAVLCGTYAGAHYRFAV